MIGRGISSDKDKSNSVPEGAAVLIYGKNALEMAEKCIFQTNANEKRVVVKRLSFNQLL